MRAVGMVDHTPASRTRIASPPGPSIAPKSAAEVNAEPEVT
jgi:hypothetical protein